MKELLTALCKAKQQFTPIKKDKVNPHFKSKYASLDSVLAAVEPGLLAHELILTSLVVDGSLTTRLYHSSGEYLESSFALPNLSDPQKLGSTISYYRRYAICGLLGVTADEDDDGNAAKPQTKAENSPPPRSTPSSQPRQPLTTATIPAIESKKQALRDCMTELGWHKTQVANFCKSVSSQRSPENWIATDYDLAIVKAHAAIDQMNSQEPAGWYENENRPQQ